MAEPLILALDVGTSSVRASLYDREARPVPGTSVKIEQSFSHRPDGAAEMDAERAFDNVVLALDQLHQLSDPVDGSIELAASCAYWHSLMGIDAGGQPTTPVLGWADTRAGDHSAKLKRDLNEIEIHNRTGARFHSSYWPAKLMWLREAREEAFARTVCWLSFSDYVGLRLFDDHATSVSMASGTGIFDQRACTWDAALLQYLGVDTSLLPVIAKDDDEFRLTGEYRERWPRFAEARWHLPIGDGAADNLGSGCTRQSRAALMIGTSGAMRVAYEGVPPGTVPPGLWCYRIDRKTVITGGAISDGGGLYEWLKTNLRLPDNFEAEIARRAPGANGITFMPFFFGERGTGYHEDATGVVLGLTSGHDAVDIMQAAMESVAFRLAEIFEQLSQLFDITDIVASGGALRDSAVWPQIIANVLGRDLMLNDALESSSKGAVLHLLKTKGKIGDEVSDLETGMSVVPKDPSRHAAYSEAKARHASAYESITKRAPRQ